MVDVPNDVSIVRVVYNLKPLVCQVLVEGVIVYIHPQVPVPGQTRVPVGGCWVGLAHLVTLEREKEARMNQGSFCE